MLNSQIIRSESLVDRALYLKSLRLARLSKSIQYFELLLVRGCILAVEDRVYRKKPETPSHSWDISQL